MIFTEKIMIQMILARGLENDPNNFLSNTRLFMFYKVENKVMSQNPACRRALIIR